MDEIKTEKTPTNTHTTINHTDPKPASGNGMMWFLMGGVIVVVAIVGYFVLGDGGVTTSTPSQPSGGNVSVNVETNDAPATEAAPADPAPAEPAPAELAPVQPAQQD